MNAHTFFAETLMVMDSVVLCRLFRLFNKSIVRTNFWKERKLCVSCRLDPSFLPAADYPDKPYAILFSVRTTNTVCAL